MRGHFLLWNALARAIVFTAGVAQLVEQRIRNAKVGGSTPSTGTKNSNGYATTAAYLRLL